MEPVNYSRDGRAREDVSGEWFVGSPVLRDLSPALGLHECRVFHVAFPDGAKTKLHCHCGGQLLIVTEGSGNLVTFGRIGAGESEFGIGVEMEVELRGGSIQYIPAGILHAHGSAGGGPLSHIAINYPSPGTGRYETVWYESDFKSRVMGRL